jgi:hypothetical protein
LLAIRELHAPLTARGEVTLKSAGKTTETAHLTGDVLIDEYLHIHREDLTQKYEQDNGPNTWSSFPADAKQNYDAKWGSGAWNALNHA